MKISVSIDTLMARQGLIAQSQKVSVDVRLAIKREMQEQATALRTQVRSHVDGELRVMRRSFIKGFSAKVLDQDSRRWPAMVVGSKIPWSGMHEDGGSINGKMLIPLLESGRRIGRKAFKAQVDALIRAGNAYFIKNARGRIVLMAENLKSFDKTLRGYKRHLRQQTGAKKLKRGQDIPIAVLVNRVTLSKRLNIESMVIQRLPVLAQGIEDRLKTLNL